MTRLIEAQVRKSQARWRLLLIAVVALSILGLSVMLLGGPDGLSQTVLGVSLHSILSADYWADPRATRLPPVKPALAEEAAADYQPQTSAIQPPAPPSATPQPQASGASNPGAPPAAAAVAGTDPPPPATEHRGRPGPSNTPKPSRTPKPGDTPAPEAAASDARGQPKPSHTPKPEEPAATSKHPPRPADFVPPGQLEKATQEPKPKP